MESSSKSKLKDRLARVFRRSSLLRTACSQSSNLLNNGTNGTTLSNEIAKEPQLFSSSRRQILQDHFDRPLSFPITSDNNRSLFNSANEAAPGRLSLDWGGCRSSRYSDAKKEKPVDDAKAKKKKKKKDKIAKDNLIDGKSCPPASPSSPSKSYYDDYYCCFDDSIMEKKGKSSFKSKVSCNMIKGKKKLSSNAYGFTSSSDSMADSDDEFGFLSSEEKETAETETLFSSKSFSSDSSGFYQRPFSRKSKSRSKKNKKKQQQEQSYYSHRPERIRSSRDGYQPVVSVETNKESSVNNKEKNTTLVVHGEEKEKMESGFPVVKQTTDPYSDFRSSMLEMIVERQIFSADKLEKLLHCYTSLNSPHHHPAILQSFSDICDVLFAS